MGDSAKSFKLRITDTVAAGGANGRPNCLKQESGKSQRSCAKKKLCKKEVVHNTPFSLVLVNISFSSAKHHGLWHGEEMVNLLLNRRAGVWRSREQKIQRTEKEVEADVSDCVIQCLCVWPPSQETSASHSSTCFSGEQELPCLPKDTMKALGWSMSMPGCRGVPNPLTSPILPDLPSLIQRWAWKQKQGTPHSNEAEQSQACDVSSPEVQRRDRFWRSWLDGELVARGS